MWPLRAAIFLLCCSGRWCCSLTRAYVKSKNFFSVLHWDAVDVPGQAVLYSVQYNNYGTLYSPVRWCQNISTPACDLTDVMRGVMTDLTLRYHARITVNGQCVGDVRFAPFRHTTLTAPQLSVASNRTHLNVTVSPPKMPWNRSIDNIRAWQGVKYSVHLTSPKSVDGKIFKGTSRSVFIWIAKTDVWYCGNVTYTLAHPGWSNQSESATFCVNVSDPDSSFQIFLWSGVLALLLLIVLPIMLCLMFVRRKPALPNVLKISISPSPLLWSDLWDQISKVEVVSDDPEPIYFRQKIPDVVPYSPQEPYRCQQDVLERDSSGYSVHYSLCLPDQTNKQTPPDPRSEETNSESALSISDSERGCETLVVPVRPTEDGQLQIHDCLFQSDPEESGSTGELAPLLTDPDQKDSRCSSAYLPVLVSDSGTGSNYRPNLLLGTPLRAKQDQRTYILRTDHPQT